MAQKRREHFVVRLRILRPLQLESSFCAEQAEDHRLPSGGSISDQSHAQLVGLRQDHLQDGHERRRLAEVAVADNVGVDVEAVRVGASFDAPGDVVKSGDDGRRELDSRTTAEVKELYSNN